MKKLSSVCKRFMWANFGVFIGKAISTYSFYKKNPGLYDLMPAPWYAELLIPLAYTAVVTAACIAIRVVIKRKSAI